MRLSAFDNSTLRKLLLAAALMPLVLLSACAKKAPQAEITGQLQTDAAITLPSGAQLQLRLTDVTGTDGAAQEIATRITSIKQLPQAYALPFDPARIDRAHRYTVDARILVDGSPRYGTDTPYPVLTEGHDRHSDIHLIVLGEARTASAPMDVAQEEIFRGELRTPEEVTLYSAGLREHSIVWIKEEHATGKRVEQANYDLKGAYLMHYRNSAGVDIEFDEHGKPLKVQRNQQVMTGPDAANLISAARNRAALLRSHALSSLETRRHREETEDPKKLAAMQTTLSKPH